MKRGREIQKVRKTHRVTDTERERQRQKERRKETEKEKGAQIKRDTGY